MIKSVIDQIRHNLSCLTVKKIADPKRKPGAVILPLFSKHNEYYILFMKRTQTVKEHKGQIAFPGGTYEQTDKDLLNTALREFTEETGIPSNRLEILGELDDCPTSTSNYIISTFVGYIHSPFQIIIAEKEVEKTIEIPIPLLINEHFKSHEAEIKHLSEPVYHYENEIIWGATAKILHQFLNIWIQTSNNQKY